MILHAKIKFYYIFNNKIMDTKNTICDKGYHYHPNHPKSDKNGCMKDTDMKDMKESYGSTSIYNAVRCFEDRRLNNTNNYTIGV